MKEHASFIRRDASFHFVNSLEHLSMILLFQNYVPSVEDQLYLRILQVFCAFETSVEIPVAFSNTGYSLKVK